MTPRVLRQMVRDEVAMWMEANQKPFGRMLAKLAEGIAPAIQGEIELSLKKSTGLAELDERDKLLEYLNDVADVMARYGLAKKESMDEASSMLDATRYWVARLTQRVEDKVSRPSADVPF